MKTGNEKRNKIRFSNKDLSVPKVLYAKILVPFITAIVISSLLLILGLHFLLQKANFCNYGIAPASMLFGVSKFITVYILVFIINGVLLLSLSVIIFYFMLHDLVFPVMRITYELKFNPDKEIQIRKSDLLLTPLVKLINKKISR